MRCLRKAILRAAGTIALYEEAIAFATETQELRDQAGCHEPPLDWLPVLRASRPQCSKVIDGATRNRGSHNHEQNRRDDTAVSLLRHGIGTANSVRPACAVGTLGAAAGTYLSLQSEIIRVERRRNVIDLARPNDGEELRRARDRQG